MRDENQPGSDPNKPEDALLQRERWETLRQLEEWLETPLIFLGFVWLILLVIEFIWGLVPILQAVVNTIWIIFLLDFLLRFILAPSKLAYLRNNWLTTIALAVPALRLFRIARLIRVLRLARATRTLNLVRVVSSLNRGMRALRRSMARHGLGYVAILTVIVILVGAAGIYALEGPTGVGIDTYGDSLWFTTLVITTQGPPLIPETAEGRILTLLIGLYAFGIFGYVTATLASFLLGQDAANREASGPGADSVEALRAEIAALRADLRALSPGDQGVQNPDRLGEP